MTKDKEQDSRVVDTQYAAPLATASENKPVPTARRMTLTCGICGHKGEDGTTYNHDCYWVFRGRT